jgi:signal transduction histidine kinase
MAETAQQRIESRILVLAPMGNDAPVTVRLLEGAGLRAHACRDIYDLTREMDKGCSVLLVAEEALGAASVQVLIDALGRQPSWSDVPIIIITTSGEATNLVFERLTVFGSAGNVTLLERPFRPLTLLNSSQVAFRARQRQFQVRDLMVERERLLANLEENVHKRTSELRETNAQLEELVYSIAHDLRAPLRAMQGFSKILVEQYGHILAEEGKQYAERVMRGAERMDALTLDLLAYGRMARSEVILGPVSMQRVWQAAAAQCEKLIEETHASVESEEPLPMVRGQEPILTQVFANLLNNALKFVKDGEPPKVRMRAEEFNGTIRLWVEDKGIGIPAEYKDRIFRVFERLDGSRYKGTGIGLSIVRKGVERMGGRVGVESELGKGSRFWVDLPKLKPVEKKSHGIRV